MQDWRFTLAGQNSYIRSKSRHFKWRMASKV